MKRTIKFFVMPFIAFFLLTFFISQKACNYIMADHPEKPMPFDHRAHLNDYGIGPDCTSCHSYYEDGRFKGLPSVGECTVCHDRQGPRKSEIIAGFIKTGETKDLVIPVRISAFEKYKDTDKPWGSYAKQAALVYFSHKVVMTMQGEDGKVKITCASCHGDKAGSRDSGMLKGKILMSECEKCHNTLNISNKCAVCHK